MEKQKLQKVLRLKTFFLIAIFSLFLLNCSKSKFVWMYYNETSCSDKWSYDINNEKLKDNVTAYLDSKGIKVLELEIYVDGTVETCTACNCKTGRRIKVKVKGGEEDNLQGEGFYK
jgi:hypothetical protein